MLAGKDKELRAALAQQQQHIDALKQQKIANDAANRFTKHDTMRVAILVMALMFVFK